MWTSVRDACVHCSCTTLILAVLDPFILNILPKSLGPVAIYITVVAIAAWFLSAYICGWLIAAAAITTESPNKPHSD